MKMFSTSIHVESRVKLILIYLSPQFNHFEIVSSLIHLFFITLHFTSSLCVSLQNKITLFLHNHNYSLSKAVLAPAICQIFLLICARSSAWIWPPPLLVSLPPSSQFTDLHVHTEFFFFSILQTLLYNRSLFTHFSPQFQHHRVCLQAEQSVTLQLDGSS